MRGPGFSSMAGKRRGPNAARADAAVAQMAQIRGRSTAAQSNLMTFFARKPAPSIAERERSPVREPAASPTSATVESEIETCLAKADMQVFQASVQRTNPIAEEIADDLEIFMQVDHTRDDFVVKLREARDTYGSIQQIPGGWKFEVQGKTYEIFDDVSPASTTETFTTEGEPSTASLDVSSESKLSLAKTFMKVFLASVQRTNPIAEEIADDLDVFMQGAHTHDEVAVKLREAKDTYQSIQRIPGGWKFEVHGKACEIIIDAGAAVKETQPSPITEAESLAIEDSGASSGGKVSVDFIDQVCSVPPSLEEIPRPCSGTPDDISNNEPDSESSNAGESPIASSETLGLAAEKAPLVLPSGEDTLRACSDAPRELPDKAPSMLSSEEASPKACRDTPGDFVEPAPSMPSLEATQTACSETPGEVIDQEFSMSPRSEQSPRPCSDTPGHCLDRSSSMPPSCEERLRVCSETPGELDQRGPFLPSSLEEVPEARVQALLQCGEEQPWKRARLDTPPRSSLQQTDVRSQSAGRMPSLRERLLSRMAKQGAPPPVIDPFEDDDSDNETPEAREQAQTQAITPSTTWEKPRDHKSLGGLSFRWKLLFHAGSKPDKKGSCSTTSASSPKPLPGKAAKEALANSARKACRKGA